MEEHKCGIHSERKGTYVRNDIVKKGVKRYMCLECLRNINQFAMASKLNIHNVKEVSHAR